MKNKTRGECLLGVHIGKWGNAVALVNGVAGCKRVNCIENLGWGSFRINGQPLSLIKIFFIWNQKKFHPIYPQLPTLLILHKLSISFNKISMHVLRDFSFCLLRTL